MKNFSIHLDAGFLLIILLACFIIEPLLQPGLPTTADIPIHLYRTLEYHFIESHGVWLPQWSPNLAYGYGYPLFIFAPPLPYMLGSGLHALGLPLAEALKVLIILTILLYATGMYLLGRDALHSPPAGLVAGIAYTFAPFALREVLLYGGNIPQYLAIGLYPWVLWAMLRLSRNPSLLWVITTALLYAAIMLSHLFHVLLITPVMLTFGLVLMVSHPPQPNRLLPWLKQCLWLYSPMPLGLMLSAYFWIPAFVERQYTRAQTDVYMEKSPFFIRYPFWDELLSPIYPLDARAANPYVPLTLGLITLSLAAIGLIGMIIQATYRPKATASTSRLLILYFALLAGAAIFMTLPLSRTVWETITILQVAEFPWRLLGLANLGLAFLAGAATCLIPQRWQWPFAAISLSLIILHAMPLLYPVTPFTQYNPHLTVADQIAYEQRSQSIGTTTLGEYLPQTVSDTPTGSPLVSLFAQTDTPARLDPASIPAGVIITPTRQTATEFTYQLDTPTPFTMRLYHFLYPGWRATLNGTPLPITAETESGLMLLAIPAGEQNLTIEFTQTSLRQGARYLSLIALMLFSLMIAHGLYHQTTTPRQAKPPLSPPHPAHLIGIILIMIALLLKPMSRLYFSQESPSGEALSAQYPVNARFENGIHLIGYDLSAEVVEAGERLDLVLYWETERSPIEANLQPFVHVDRLHDGQTVALNTNYTPGDVTTESVLPTFHWEPGRYIRDEHHLLIPPNTPPQAYAVRVGFIDPDHDNQRLMLTEGQGDAVQLGHINIKPSFWAQAESPATPLEIQFGQIQLEGVTLDAMTTETLTFTLFWQATTPLEQDYTVFAQLLDEHGALVANYDSPPLAGAYPTSTWLPAQPILDPRHIPLEGVPAGSYRLIVGLYEPQTGQRLSTTTGSDFAEIAVVIIP